MAIVDRFKQESMYGLSAKKWREVAIRGGSTLLIIVHYTDLLKGAVSRNSAKLGHCKMPVKLKET